MIDLIINVFYYYNLFFSSYLCITETRILPAPPPKAAGVSNDVPYLLKNDMQDTCLEISGVENNLVLSKCNNANLEQHWKTISVPNRKGYSTIVNISKNKILTSSNTYRSNGAADVFMKSYDSNSKHQIWQYEKTNKVLSSFELYGFCLTGYQKGSWMVRIELCIPVEKIKQWSFVPVQDVNNGMQFF